MNKQPIITILLALVAVTGQAQTFIPVVEDSIDFVIEGTVSEGADSVCMNERPYTGPLWFPVHNKHFRIAVRQPLHMRFWQQRQICYFSSSPRSELLASSQSLRNECPLTTQNGSFAFSDLLK